MAKINRNNIEKLVGCLENAGFDDYLVGEIINSDGNKYAEEMFNSTASFRFVKELIVTIPLNYKHSTWLESFFKRNKRRAYFATTGMGDDKGNSRVSTKLVGGMQLKVEIYHALKWVTPEYCIDFLKNKKAIFIGAQGLSLVWDIASSELPSGVGLLSMDEKEALWKDEEGNPRAHYVKETSAGNWYFDAHFFQPLFIHNNDCVLCFTITNEGVAK